MLRLTAALLVIAAGAASARFWAPEPPALPVGAIALVDLSHGTVPGAGPLDGVRASHLLLASLDDRQLSQLGRALGRIADDFVFRQSPLYLDLDEPEPEAAALAELRPFLPVLQASATLAEGAWHSADRKWLAVAIENCDDAPKGTAHCEPLWGAAAEDGPLARRARFLGWAVTAAAVLRVKNGADAARLRTALRERVTHPESRLGLVLGGPAEYRAPPSALKQTLERLRERRRIVEKTLPELARWFLEAESSPAAGLTLPEDVVLVSPRLGALALLEDFARELEEIAGSVQVELEWLARPRLDARPSPKPRAAPTGWRIAISAR